MTADKHMPAPRAGRPTGLSRRNFLRGVGAGGAAVAGAGLLAGCGSDSGSSSAAGADQSKQDMVVNFANWPLYIDQKKVNGVKTRPTLDAFKEQTGVTVNYTEPINDNESFFSKIRPVLAAGGDTGYDVFALTDWMAARLLTLDYIEKLDKSNIPNAKNIIAPLKSPSWDPNRDYSIPWQSGLTGIAYDTSLTGEITSISQLFTDPSLAGKVTVLTEMRDTMGLVMLDQGNDPSTFDQAAWDQAFSAVQDASDSGQIRQFTGNDYAQLLAKGDIFACMAWSGDIVQLQFDNPNIKFVVPDAGAMLWSDNMLIPDQAAHKLNAELLMNYYYDPKVAAQLAAWVNYICPVEGAQAEMQKIDPSLAANPLIFPTAKDLANLTLFRALTPDEDAKYTAQFQTLYT